MTLTIIYKGKRKQCDLNNCRGIWIIELTAKVISSVEEMRLLTVEMGHPQPPTLLLTDNTTTTCYSNDTIKKTDTGIGHTLLLGQR
jgi:hypothetical protein